MIKWDAKLFSKLQLIIKQNNKLKMNIVSDSMTPLIHTGDEIEVKSCSNFSRFDIIVFKHQDKLFCHFIWDNSSFKENAFITKSLKNPLDIDYTVSHDEILGKVSNFNLSFINKSIVILKNVLY